MDVESTERLTREEREFALGEAIQETVERGIECLGSEQAAVEAIADRIEAWRRAITRFRSRPSTITAALRWAIWERDNFTCLRCGTRRDLTIDHITPTSKGGSSDWENLQTLCRSCNSRKGGR